MLYKYMRVFYFNLTVHSLYLIVGIVAVVMVSGEGVVLMVVVVVVVLVWV